jgi:hypothetical protein
MIAIFWIMSLVVVALSNSLPTVYWKSGKLILASVSTSARALRCTCSLLCDSLVQRLDSGFRIQILTDCMRGPAVVEPIMRVDRKIYQRAFTLRCVCVCVCMEFAGNGI